MDYYTNAFGQSTGSKKKSDAVDSNLQKETMKWSSERVNQIMLAIDRGYDVANTPFWDGKPEWRLGNIVFEYTPEEVEELKRCSEDVIYFANKYCFVMTDEGIRNITLRDYQEDILRAYQAHNKVVFVAPRQIGKTITTAIFLTWYLLFNTDKNLMILANNGTTSEELVDKVKTVLSNLPFFMKPGIIVNNVMSMKFDNGCRLFGRTTTKNTGIGFTIHFLYMDEFAHIHPNFIEPFYRAVYPTIAASKNSRVIITSTPNGINKFYDIYTAAMLPEGAEGKNDYFPLRVDWWQVPGRDEAWRKKEIANLGSEEDFNQEYNCQFLSSSRLLLDSENLAKIKKSAVEYEWREIDRLADVLQDPLLYEHLRWHPKFDLDSISPDDRFVFSIDTAGGGGGDYTVVNIFKLVPMTITSIKNKRNYRDESDFLGLLQVGIFRSNRAGVEEVQPIIETLIYQVLGAERCTIVLEMDFKGNLLYERMSSHNEFYSGLFVHTKHTENARFQRPGIKLNPKNKLEYCYEMRKLVKGGRIMITEKYTFEELWGFGLNGKGSYSSQSGHDDCAMTIVNLSTYFSSNQYLAQVEDIYDKLPKQYRDAIAEKINKMNEDEEGSDLDGDFLKNMMG